MFLGESLRTQSRRINFGISKTVSLLFLGLFAQRVHTTLHCARQVTLAHRDRLKQIIRRSVHDAPLDGAATTLARLVAHRVVHLECAPAKSALRLHQRWRQPPADHTAADSAGEVTEEHGLSSLCTLTGGDELIPSIPAM